MKQTYFIRSAEHVDHTAPGRLLSHRQFLRHATGLAAGTLMLAACGTPTASTPTPGLTAAPFRAEVAVSHIKSLMSLMAWTVGQEKGFFQAAGLEQSFAEYEGGGDRRLRSGRAGADYWRRFWGIHGGLCRQTR